FFAAKSSRMAVTSTVGGGEEYVAGAVGVVGLAGVGGATLVVGGSTAGELGSAVACPNIFDMRLVRIPIMAGVYAQPVQKTSSPVLLPPVIRSAAKQKGELNHDCSSFSRCNLQHPLVRGSRPMH